MSDIYIYVAVSGNGLSDRDSDGRKSSPNLPNIHHTHTETNASHSLTGKATSPESSLGAGEVQ
jgi:hypothetical protein